MVYIFISKLESQREFHGTLRLPLPTGIEPEFLKEAAS